MVFVWKICDAGSTMRRIFRAIGTEVLVATRSVEARPSSLGVDLSGRDSDFR